MNRIYLQVGDVFRHSGSEYVVDMVNESRARAHCLSRRVHSFTDNLSGEQVEFRLQANEISVAPMTEPGEVLRNDINLVRSPGRKQQTKNTKGNTVMPTKEKAEKTGALGGLFGCSVTSVLRRLGKEGVTTAHARDIMKAKKVKTSDTTVSIQVNNGKNGKGGEVAELTKAQVKELTDSAEDPAIAEAKEKKEKEAAEAKAKKEKEAAAK